MPSEASRATLVLRNDACKRAPGDVSIGEIIFRFLIGGAVVSFFALVGQAFKPETFSGLFSAAPSVALATLGLAYAKHGGACVVTESRAMIIGAVAFIAYGIACVALGKRHGVPVWLSAGVSWLAWLGVAAIGVLFIRAIGAA